MTISPFDLILLLGSGQGFILAVLLWINRKGRRLSNRLLAVLIGLLALMSLAVGIPITNKWVALALDFLPLFMVMPIGPLLFFYAKSVLDPTYQLSRADRRHFWPVILDWVAPLLGWTFLAGVWLGFLEQKDGPTWGGVMIDYNTYVDIPRWMSVTVYLLLTYQLLNRQQSTDGQLAVDQQRRRWLVPFVNAFLIFQVIWLLFLVPYALPAFRGPLLDRVGWYPVYIPIAGLIYWLGLRGYLQSRQDVVEPLNRKPAGISLPPETVTSILARLTKAMEIEQLYLDPELSVDKLGKHLQLSPKLISAVLNQYQYTNFNTYINRYRIEAVKQRLSDPANGYLTLTGIALECGFNSQATFQRTFKQQTGLSPREYAVQPDKNTAQIRI